MPQCPHGHFLKAMLVARMPECSKSGPPLLDPIKTLTQIKARHVSENNSALGVNCFETGQNDMKKEHVIETLHSKKSQILLATQLVKMILKIDDVRSPSDM